MTDATAAVVDLIERAAAEEGVTGLRLSVAHHPREGPVVEVEPPHSGAAPVSVALGPQGDGWIHIGQALGVELPEEGPDADPWRSVEMLVRAVFRGDVAERVTRINDNIISSKGTVLIAGRKHSYRASSLSGGIGRRRTTKIDYEPYRT